MQRTLNAIRSGQFAPERGFVPDEKTAVRIAEAVLIPPPSLPCLTQHRHDFARAESPGQAVSQPSHPPKRFVRAEHQILIFLYFERYASFQFGHVISEDRG
jgi:hypothetical protein